MSYISGGMDTGPFLTGGGGLLPPNPYGTQQTYQSNSQASDPTTVAGVRTGVPQGLGLRHVDAQGNLAGLNWGTVGAIGGVVGSLADAWSAWQQNKIAREQMAMQKEAYNTNMNMTVKTYNTALEDRLNARYAAHGNEAGAAAHIESERLTRDSSRTGRNL